MIRSLWVGLLAVAAALGQTGRAVGSLTHFDAIMSDLMRRYEVPGGSLAIAVGGRIVFARGYGFADREAAEPVEPDSLFRVASISKLVTAAAAMQLHEEGRIDLDSPAFAYLPDLLPPQANPADARLWQITVRHLLYHAGGWDRELSFDPADALGEIAMAMGTPSPADCRTVIRFMLGRPLDFTPGSQARYSNFGYCVLGAIVEHVSGLPYERFVRERLLMPLGLTRMRVGGPRLPDRLTDEVKYYDHPRAGLGPSPFPDGPRQVPWPYGGFVLDPLGSYGGWVASAPDLVRMMNSLEGYSGVFAIAPESVRAMVTRPPVTIPNDGFHYGYGIFVRSVGDGSHWWHGGSIPGSYAYLVRTVWGVTFAVVFNSRPRDAEGFATELDRRLLDAVRSTTAWPSDDLTAELYPPDKDAPAIHGVVNGASFGAGISAGGWITIFGAALASNTREWSTADFVGDRLPLLLGRVWVKLNGRRAPVYYTSPGQLNVLAPGEEIGANLSLQAVRDSVASPPVAIELGSRAPALFSYSAESRRFAAAVDLEGVLVGLPETTPGSRPAIPGRRILLYGAGLMPSVTTSIPLDPQPLDAPVRVSLSEVPAVVEFAGLVGPGLFQLNIVVPPVAGGLHEVLLEVDGWRAQPRVFLPVEE